MQHKKSLLQRKQKDDGNGWVMSTPTLSYHPTLTAKIASDFYMQSCQ